MSAIKRTVGSIVFGVISILLFAGNPALADDDPWNNTVWGGYADIMNPNWEDDFSVTTGVKVWMNEWRQDLFVPTTIFDSTPFPVGAFSISNPAAKTSDLEATPIPQLSIRYKWLFATGSYFSETDYRFEPVLIDSVVFSDSFSGFTQNNVVNRTSAERYEYDFAGGIYIHPNIAILGGYKRIQQNFVQNVTNTVTDAFQTRTFSGTFNNSINVTGPTIGIAGSVPIGSGFGIYANYAHGFMNVDITDSSGEFAADATYDVAELGFTYTYGMSNLPVYMPLSAASVYAGYRWQNFETEFDANEFSPAASTRSDTTRGFVVGLNLSWL
jgi:hypothetical protein